MTAAQNYNCVREALLEAGADGDALACLDRLAHTAGVPDELIDDEGAD